MSTAVDGTAQQTRLQLMADDAVRRSGFTAAFKPIPVASAAYRTLTELASLATKTLDLQTFVLLGDASGAGVLVALRDAAARGVRVRILIDDLHTDSAEALLSDLAGFDGVEIRLINPFTRLRGSREMKLISSLDELDRVNHRMHNKLFIADNALAVIGGRNVGDPYYMRVATGLNFIDLDMLVAGKVVRQMSASFDEYWNSEFAWPIDAIVAPPGDREVRRARFDDAASRLSAHVVDAGVQAGLQSLASAPDELRKGALEMTGADAELIADPPDKLQGTRVDDRTGTVRAAIGAAGLAAQSEVFVVSPYYVPGRVGIQSLRRNHRDGVRLRLITNSLAATDEPAVHAGYLEYRSELIGLGMEIYELSPTLAAQDVGLRGMWPDATAALHMKIIFFDRFSVFIGSMNLDGRSERYNTEVGLMIRSTELAHQLLPLVALEPSSYRVEFDDQGGLRWIGWQQGHQDIHQSEPEADVSRTLSSKFLGLLIPSDWL